MRLAVLVTTMTFAFSSVAQTPEQQNAAELGTEVAAILYSFSETAARRHGVDPKAYLAATLDDALEGRTIHLRHDM